MKYRVYRFDNGRLHKPQNGGWFPKYEYNEFEEAEQAIIKFYGNWNISPKLREVQYIIASYDSEHFKQPGASSTDIVSTILKIF